MYWFQIWPPGGLNCISSNFGHQVALAVLPLIAFLAVSVELVSSSARVTSVKFQKGLGLSELETTEPIDRAPGTPGSDKNNPVVFSVGVLLPLSATVDMFANQL